jgi:hypothetical protein
VVSRRQARVCRPAGRRLILAGDSVGLRGLLEVVGADVVEVIPVSIGTADSSALVAERPVGEVLTGIAMRR